ncbi:MAG: xanthine dehydrogenase family protein molybdopterin-binding subunit, partial [Proteobacteria bacterium]|nr:xanthine dehydrogenase family protein molybdopterin-binding subunit [Pseudomonadota bacterium]
MSSEAPEGRRFRYVSRKRRTKEDRRFITGEGRFVADISLPGMKHIALVTSPHPAAHIVAIRTEEALKIEGVVAVITGEELAQATNPLMSGLNLPDVRRYPLAVDRARYAGEWVAAVVADSRYIAEDGAERIEV